jgi:malate dehydrogenase
MRSRVSVIGRGEIAEATSRQLAGSGIDVILFEPANGSGSPIRDRDAESAQVGFRRTSEARDTAGADVLVVTSDQTDPRRAAVEMSRAAGSAASYSEGAMLVVADHASNALCDAVRIAAAAPGRLVIGTGTLPDSVRFEELIARELRITPHGVEALAIGRVSKALPLVRFATAAGIPVSEVLESDRLAALLSEFRGSEGQPKTDDVDHIVSSQADAIGRIVKALGPGDGDLLPCTTLLTGEYGIDGVYLSGPAVLGPEGVERRIELDLDLDELLLLRLAAEEVQAETARLTNGNGSPHR